MKSDALIVKAFGRFAAAGYPRSLFTKDLYWALSRTFGFIAHYDLNGFYEARFEGPLRRVDTFAIMLDGEEPLTDLEKRLRLVAVTMQLKEHAVAELAVDVEQRERAELARLKAKYKE